MSSLDETVDRSFEDDKSSVSELELSTKLDDEVIVTVETRTDDRLVDVVSAKVTDADKVMYDVENELVDIEFVDGVTDGMDDNIEECELLSKPVSSTVLTADDVSKEDPDDNWTVELEPLTDLEGGVEINEDDSTEEDKMVGIENDLTELEIVSETTLDVYEEVVKEEEGTTDDELFSVP